MYRWIREESFFNSKMELKIKIWLGLFISIFLFSYADASVSRPSGEKILTIKTTKNTSLPELIKSSGYDIDDKDVGLFLRDFMSLNRNIKGLSVISKGTTVRLPVKNLIAKKKRVSLHRRVKKIKEKKEPLPEYQAGEGEVILKNIKVLLGSLAEATYIRSEGIKVFSINDKSELSFNTSFFPIIELADNRIIMLDYQGILPEEIGDIIEVSWPEYKIVSNHETKDTKNIIRLLLDSIGYSSFSGSKVILGGKIKIEFSADFLVMKKSDDILKGEIIVISIIEPNEYRTPDELKKWAENRGVRIIELFLREPPLSQSMAEVVYMSEKGVDKFSERFLTLLGYEFKRGDYLRLSDREEYEFNIRAALTITSGNRIKAIDFSEISEPAIRYAKKRGFDMIGIGQREGRSDVVRKIMGLLSINYNDKPEATSSYITPKGVKYRLIAPGILVKSKNGLLFLPDPEACTEFPSPLFNDAITLVKF